MLSSAVSSGAFYALLALEAQKDKDRETERNREEKAAPLLSLRRAVALERVGSRRPPSPASTRRLTPESKFPIGACGFAPLRCLRHHFRTSASHISSVRWVHGAVATLLLLLLLHEELLQRRRTWLHHRAGPDRLRTHRSSSVRITLLRANITLSYTMLHSTQ